MSDSSQPHGLQPTRFLCLWDFPGKSTGVGCHCLLCGKALSVCKNKTGADCGSDHELLIVKWRLKLNTVGRTTRSSSQSVISVALSCPILCDSMDCSTLGFPVHHQLPELAQTHVHSIGDAIESVMAPFSVVPFSSCPQSFPATGYFLMS